MQRDDGLAGAGPAVDDERAARAGADDRVLVGLDRAEHVAHPRRPAAAEAGDERRLVVEGGRVPVEPVGGEDLVPVVGDPAAGPAVAAAAGQPIGSACVAPKNGSAAGERQSTSSRRPSRSVSPSASDVDRLAAVRAAPCGRGRGRARSGAACAAATVSRCTSRSRSSDSAGALAGALRGPREARGQVGDGRLRGTAAMVGEVVLVGGDQGGVGLGGEAVGQGEDGGGEGRHDGRFWGLTGALRQAPPAAIP